MQEPETDLLRFGPFELDPHTGELRREGETAPLAPQPARVLALLASRAPEIVLRAELQQEVWPDTVVDYDSGLNFCILQIRRALGDDAEEPSYIETLPRRGYRFIEPVERVRRPRRSSASGRLRRAVGGGRSHRHADGRGPAGTPRAPAAVTATSLVLLGVVAIVVGGWLANSSGGGQLSDPDEATAAGRADPDRGFSAPVLAVVPFEHLGPGSGDGYLGSGLADEITAELAVLDPARVSVLAPSSAGGLAGATEALPRAAARLGADLVLTGTVRRAEGRVRVIARLIETGDGTQLWARSYERPVGDLATLQRDVAAQVATSLALGLRGSHDGATPVANRPEAVERYLEARYLLSQRRREEIRRSIELFRQALALEPEYPAALAGLATAHLFSGEPVKETMPEVRRAALRAVQLDPLNAEAHLRLGDVRVRYDWDWAGARDAYERAIALAPQLAEAHYHHAGLLSQMGLHEEAIDAVRRARLLDPVSPAVNVDAGWIYFFARRYDEAIDQCRRALRLWPRSRHARECLLNAHLHTGDLSRAAEEARRLLPLLGVPDDAVRSVDPRRPEAALARFWKLYLEQLPEAETLPGEAPLLRAIAHAALGNRDVALEALERALAERAGTLVFAGVDPRLDPLRGSERFRGVLRDLGLEGRADARRLALPSSMSHRHPGSTRWASGTSRLSRRKRRSAAIPPGRRSSA